jgi:hypothetical protein
MAYHIYGDSNVARYLSAVKARSTDPQFQTITTTKTTNLVLLRDALSKPTVAHPVIVISAITNLLTAKYFDNYDLMVDHCKTTFGDIQTWVQEGRDTLDDFAQQVCLFVTRFLTMT